MPANCFLNLYLILRSSYKLLLLHLFLVLNPVSQSYAATDGSLGATSTGTTDLSLSISDMVRVTGMADFSFGNYGGSGTATLDDNICIYTNNPTGQYVVTATGDGAGSAFTVDDNNSHVIAYTVRFNDQTGTSGNVALTTNVASATQSGANTTSQTCAGGNTANIEISITQSALMSVPAATYSGVLTLVVEPN